MELLKKFSPAIFGLIILCFFFPFVNLSCSGQTVISLTGFQLITGAEYSEKNMLGQDMFGEMNNAEVKEEKEIEAQPLALFAFLTAFAGLAVSFIRKKITALLSLVISVLGAVFLILLKINIDGDAQINGQGVIELEYQAGYWLTLLLFIIAAIIYWFMFNEKKKLVVETNETSPPTITQ